MALCGRLAKRSYPGGEVRQERFARAGCRQGRQPKTVRCLKMREEERSKLLSSFSVALFACFCLGCVFYPPRVLTVFPQVAFATGFQTIEG